MAADQYNSFASYYASLADLPSEIVATNLLRKTLSRLPHGIKVLDLGCGTGNYARMLLQLDIADSITGVDISNEMVRVGQAIEQEQRPTEPRITFHVANCAETLEHLGLSPNSFDLVMGNWLFNYAADSEQLKAMWRNIVTYLKPGADFIGLIPTFDIENHLGRSAWNGITYRWQGKVKEGSKVQVTAHCKPQIQFDNYCLSSILYEQTPLQLGMKDVSFGAPTESDLPVLSQSDTLVWKEYLGNPVSVVCTAKKA